MWNWKTKLKCGFFCADFKKLHEAHFNKMESIDSYVQRKTKQMDTYRSSVKDMKVLNELLFGLYKMLQLQSLNYKLWELDV